MRFPFSSSIVPRRASRSLPGWHGISRAAGPGLVLLLVAGSMLSAAAQPASQEIGAPPPYLWALIGNDGQHLAEERAAEAEVNRHLRLEIETLRSPARIERLATGRLQMIAPGPDDASVIERVLPTAPPPRSVVAQR